MNKIINWLGSGIFRTLGRFLAYILIILLIALISTKIDLKNILFIDIVKADTNGTYTSANYEVKQCKQSCNVNGTNCTMYNCISDSKNFNTSMSFGSDNGHINRYQFLLYNNTSNGWDTGAWDITLQLWKRPNNNAKNLEYNYRFYANDKASTSGAISGTDTKYISNYVCQQWTNNEDWYIRCKFYNKVPIKFFMIELELPNGENWTSGKDNVGMDNLSGLYWWGIDNFTGSTDTTGAINNLTSVTERNFIEVKENQEETKGILRQIIDIFKTGNLINLIVPTEEQMQDLLNDMQEEVNTKLGILGLPLTIYTRFMNLVMTESEENWCFNWQGINVPNFEDSQIIPPGRFCFRDILQNEHINDMRNVSIYLIGALIILQFIQYLMNSLHRVLDVPDRTDYEYITTEDVYGINNNTGEVQSHQIRNRTTYRRERN